MITLHNAVFGFFQRVLENWFLGLAARLVFAATLFMFFYTSFQLKVGAGLAGLGEIQPAAYFTILGQDLIDRVTDPLTLEMWPWGALVHLATYAEIALPVLIVLGFLTRIASLGMLIFVAAMSWVDLTGTLVPLELIAPAPPLSVETAVGGISTETAPQVAPTLPEPPARPSVQELFFLDLGGATVDQRAMWMFLLLYLTLRGAGAISLDRLFGGRPYDDDEYEDY